MGIMRMQPEFRHEDERGCLTQLVHEGYEQVNVLCSKKGAVRGNHYHKNTLEAFYILFGSVNLTYRDVEQKDGDYKKMFSAGDFFSITPYTVHKMEFPEDCIMVQLYSRTVEIENGKKDIFKEADNG